MISILQESLRLVMEAVFQFVDILLEFLGIGERCFLLGSISLPGPR